MKFTVGMLVEWIISHRRGNAFVGYSSNTIALEIADSIKQNVFTYEVDSNGQLCGVVCGTKDATSKIVTIHDVLAIKSFVLRKFMQVFLSLYPDYTIICKRKGKMKQFKNASKLAERLR